MSMLSGNAHLTAILVVDDDSHVVQLTCMYLSREGYTALSASTGEDALRIARAAHPDLIILDLILPGSIDGWEAGRQLRAESDVAIIILSARDEGEDKLAGLELGADDYVTKPFNARELVARVRAVLRRCDASNVSRSVLTVGDVCVDPLRYEVTVGGQPIVLARKEFKVLAVLARYPGIVFPRERLVQLVWSAGRGSSRALDVHISWLRQKLRSSSVRIDGVYGIGYRLVVARNERKVG
jgi:DNA-binding response OmpR family regulator